MNIMSGELDEIGAEIAMCERILNKLIECRYVGNAQWHVSE